MTDKELWAIEQRMEKGWTEGDTFSDIQPPADVAALFAELGRMRVQLKRARCEATFWYLREIATLHDLHEHEQRLYDECETGRGGDEDEGDGWVVGYPDTASRFYPRLPLDNLDKT